MAKLVGQLAIGLACILRLCPAQVDPTNHCGKNMVDCCERLKTEALNACLEYEPFGFTIITCLPWIEVIEDSCFSQCGNCWAIGNPLEQICRFQLQVLGNADLIKKYCNETIYDFALQRCPPACNMTKEDCWTKEATDCMLSCGNYNSCECREYKGSTQDGFCTGDTVVDGSGGTRPGMFYSCGLVPPRCLHTNYANKCSKYKYCPPDLCLIQDVDCSPRHQCEAEGTCDPSKGMCFWANQETDYPCDDDIFYTLNDSCQDGFCIGTPDYCLGYNVSCMPLSSCLTGGTCHPNSGRCTYEKLPDETPCDDGRKYTVQDLCQDGLCVGRPQDLCESFGVVCEAPNWCYDAGICDPKTGICSEATLAAGWRPCNDRDPTTTNDSCIDGVCLGHLEVGLDGYKFLTMGDGECADRDGRRMARYTGDVEDEKECEMVCRGDPQCAGFSYAFPLCSIYGTVRNKAPAGRTWSFQAGTDPPAVIIEQALMSATGQRKTICRKKGMIGDTVIQPSDIEVDVDDFFSPVRIAGFLLVVLGCFFLLPIIRFCTKIICCRKDEMEVMAMQVAQDPGKDASGGFQAEDADQNALRDGAEGDEPLPPPEYDPAAPPPLDTWEDPDPPPSTPPNPPGSVEADQR